MPQSVPFPVNPRQLLQLFAFYEPQRGLPSVLNRIVYHDVHRRDIVAAALGRIPENRQAVIDGPDFAARPVLSAALHGQEFQTRIREQILHAFPEKKRLIFIHIPKCAGSDLIAGLRNRMPLVHHHLALPHTMSKPDLFSSLREIAIGLHFSGSIAISGHVNLRWYKERNLLRHEDDLFTVVREPRAMVYSYISFILTRLKTFVGVERGDTTGWLAAIGMTAIEPDPSPAYLAEIGSRLLRAPSVTNRNMICGNIGRGDVSSTFDALVTTNMEVSDTKRYSAWKQQRFGIPAETRINESLPLFTPEIASAADREFIEEMVTEDLVAYAKITKRLDETGELSVRGGEFA
jgi:hypothetical protein